MTIATNGNGHKKIELDANELLKQSKLETATATKPTGEQVEKPQSPPPRADKKSSAIAKTTTVENEIAAQASALVEDDKNASAIQLKSGLRDGEKAGKVYDAGYKLGFIKAVRKSRLTNTVELAKQLNLLAEHTDQQTGEQTQETLDNLLKADDQQLEEMLLEMEVELEELLGKKEGTSSKSLLGF